MSSGTQQDTQSIAGFIRKIEGQLHDCQDTLEEFKDFLTGGDSGQDIDDSESDDREQSRGQRRQSRRGLRKDGKTPDMRLKENRIEAGLQSE
jgi:hypothetical protein